MYNENPLFMCLMSPQGWNCSKYMYLTPNWLTPQFEKNKTQGLRARKWDTITVYNLIIKNDTCDWLKSHSPLLWHHAFVVSKWASVKHQFICWWKLGTIREVFPFLVMPLQKSPRFCTNNNLFNLSFCSILMYTRNVNSRQGGTAYW